MRRYHRTEAITQVPEPLAALRRRTGDFWEVAWNETHGTPQLVVPFEKVTVAVEEMLSGEDAGATRAVWVLDAMLPEGWRGVLILDAATGDLLERFSTLEFFDPDGFTDEDGAGAGLFTVRGSVGGEIEDPANAGMFSEFLLRGESSPSGSFGEPVACVERPGWSMATSGGLGQLPAGRWGNSRRQGGATSQRD